MTSTVKPLAVAAAGSISAHAASDSLNELVAKIKSPDENVSGPAWQNAHQHGAAAIGALAPLLAEGDFEVARNAKRAIYQVIRHAGRPGADREKRQVEKQLVPLLKSPVASVRRDALWMLSEVGGDGAIPNMASLLNDREVREDARCALMRIPGKKATDSLKAAFKRAPEDFKHALADAMRRRGEKVEGYPSRKLVPTAQTSVTALAEKSGK